MKRDERHADVANAVFTPAKRTRSGPAVRRLLRRIVPAGERWVVYVGMGVWKRRPLPRRYDLRDGREVTIVRDRQGLQGRRPDRLFVLGEPDPADVNELAHLRGRIESGE